MTAWIERLNADALAHIFHIITDTSDIPGDDQLEGDIRGAIAISQVCSHWRSLILDLPTIWAKLFNFESKIILDRRWSQEILRRSADAPLKIRCSFKRDAENVHSLLHLVTGVLEKEWHRTRSISITFDRGLKVEGIQDLVSLSHRPAPSLETFEWLADSEQISLTSLADTTDLFGNEAPIIRNFCYNGGLSPISISSQWLSTLRILKLYIHSPNITGFLSALGRMPRLEILEIKTAQQEIELGPPSLSQPIRLSHLHVLRLFGWWKTVTHLIDAIDVVALSEMVIEAEHYHPDANFVMGLESFGIWYTRLLRNHLSATRTPRAIISVSKMHGGPRMFDFDLGKYQVSFVDYSSDNRMQHHITTWFLQLLSSFDLDPVTDLIFNVNLNSKAVVPHQSQIRDIFYSLSHLTKICAAWPYLTDIRELLSSMNGVFPSLRIIKIPNTRFGIYPAVTRERALGILRSFISWRIDDGRPIKVFELGLDQDIFRFNTDEHYLELDGLPDLNSLIWVQESGDLIKQQIKK